MLRIARSFVPNASVAEDVVQDTWIALLRGIDNFEGRSSLRVWLMRILRTGPDRPVCGSIAVYR
jgi:RNA polymerase sigma-70 factor (ECF subfamily)